MAYWTSRDRVSVGVGTDSAPGAPDRPKAAETLTCCQAWITRDVIEHTCRLWAILRGKSLYRSRGVLFLFFSFNSVKDRILLEIPNDDSSLFVRDGTTWAWVLLQMCG